MAVDSTASSRKSHTNVTDQQRVGNFMDALNRLLNSRSSSVGGAAPSSDQTSSRRHEELATQAAPAS